MDTTDLPSPLAGEGGARSASDEGAAAAPSLAQRVSALIDETRHRMFAETSVARDTELWNAVHSRFETLKADISRLITEA